MYLIIHYKQHLAYYKIHIKITFLCCSPFGCIAFITCKLHQFIYLLNRITDEVTIKMHSLVEQFKKVVYFYFRISEYIIVC